MTVNLTAQLAELSGTITAARNKLKEQAAGAFKESFAAFFEKHPEVHALYWTQYTPHFNDGEPCTFGTHDKTIVYVADGIADTEIDGSESTEFNKSYWSARGASFSWETDRDKGPAVDAGDLTSRWNRQFRKSENGTFGPHPTTAREVASFIDELGKVDDEAYEALGEGLVIVTRDGVAVEDYSHD